MFTLVPHSRRTRVVSLTPQKRASFHTTDSGDVPPESFTI